MVYNDHVKTCGRPLIAGCHGCYISNKLQLFFWHTTLILKKALNLFTQTTSIRAADQSALVVIVAGSNELQTKIAFRQMTLMTLGNTVIGKSLDDTQVWQEPRKCLGFVSRCPNSVIINVETIRHGISLRGKMWGTSKLQREVFIVCVFETQTFRLPSADMNYTKMIYFFSRKRERKFYIFFHGPIYYIVELYNTWYHQRLPTDWRHTHKFLAMKNITISQSHQFQ